MLGVMMKNDDQKKIVFAIIFLLLLLLGICFAAMMSTYNDSVDPEEYDTDPPAVTEEDFNNDEPEVIEDEEKTEPQEQATVEDKPSYTNEEYGFSISYPERYSDFTGEIYIRHLDAVEVLNVADESTVIQGDAPWEGFILSIEENISGSFPSYINELKENEGWTFVEEDVSFGDTQAVKLVYTSDVGFSNISVYVYDSGNNQVIIFSPPEEYDGFSEIYKSIQFN